MILKIVQGDITTAAVDVIVNAANTELRRGGGVCGAIFKASKHPKKLQEECNRLAPIETGQSVLTDAYELPCKYIIHTAGPIYVDDITSRPLLIKSYQGAMKLADMNYCKSIAFPLISVGIYAYPLNQAIEIAVKTIREYESKSLEEAFLYCIDNNIYHALKIEFDNHCQI